MHPKLRKYCCLSVRQFYNAKKVLPLYFYGLLKSFKRMGNLFSEEVISTETLITSAVNETEGGVRTSIEDSPNNAYDVKAHSLLSGPHKMVLCVNMSLNMGKGKIAAQCSHATLGAYKVAMKTCPNSVAVWEYIGQAKIAVKVDDEEKMKIIENAAKEAGLVTYLVRDAGKTQIAFGSKTVLAIGPAPISAFEGITSDLKLL